MPFMLKYLLAQIQSVYAASRRKPTRRHRANVPATEKFVAPKIIGWDRIAEGKPSERNGYGCKPDLGFDPRSTSHQSRHIGGGTSSRFGHGRGF